MLPSDYISVQLFQQKIAGHLSRYADKDDNELLGTLKLAIAKASHDSVLLLRKELSEKTIDLEELLSEYVSELAEYNFHHPDYSDPIIDLIRQKDLFSFSEKLEDLKDLEHTLKRMERKRLKDELIKFDEEEEAEEIRQALMRNERKELKRRLKSIDEPAAAANYSSDSAYTMSDNYEFNEDRSAPKTGSRYIWLKVAAILVVILVPLGILFFSNLNSSGSNQLSSNNGDGETNSSAVYSVGDLDALMALSLPAEELKEAIVKVVNEGGNLGYAQEDEEIKIIVISRKIQIAHLEEKSVLLEAKIKELESELNKSLKSGSGQGPRTKELKESINKLERRQSEFLALKASILSKEMYYEFNGKELKIYSNKTGAKRFSIESRLDLENDSKKEYFLFIDGVEYTKLNIKGKV
jgi:hypothetical protein